MTECLSLVLDAKDVRFQLNQAALYHTSEERKLMQVEML